LKDIEIKNNSNNNKMKVTINKILKILIIKCKFIIYPFLLVLRIFKIIKNLFNKILLWSNYIKVKQLILLEENKVNDS